MAGADVGCREVALDRSLSLDMRLWEDGSPHDLSVPNDRRTVCSSPRVAECFVRLCVWGCRGPGNVTPPPRLWIVCEL